MVVTEYYSGIDSYPTNVAIVIHLSTIVVAQSNVLIIVSLIGF